MRETAFHQPDTEAMERLLVAHSCDRAGVVLRLAWRAGLTRDEIASLDWERVDIAAALLRLGEREVPMEEETARCLGQWRLAQEGGETKVMPVAPQSVSRIARRALDAAGQTRVRLLDLRLDFVRRQMEVHDWPYVLRISGFSVTTYRLVLARFRQTGRPAARHGGETDELKLWKALQAERGTPAGIALWLAQHPGLTAQEIVALTWNEVDLAAGVLRLADGERPLTQATRSVLAAEKARRAPEDDPHVLLTPRTRKPMGTARLSALVRDALIRGGLEDLSLSDMRRGSERKTARQRILDFARDRGSVTRGDVTALLGVTESAAHRRLAELVRGGALVRVNARYYLPGTVVPAGEQEQAVLDFIARYGTAYRQDVAELLHIGPRPAARILNRMVESGELVRPDRSRRYMLPKRENS